MIGNEQAIGADETGRTAGTEADGGLLQMLEPGVIGIETVTLVEDLARRLIIEPHAFIGAGRDGKSRGEKQEEFEVGHRGHRVFMGLILCPSPVRGEKKTEPGGL